MNHERAVASARHALAVSAVISFTLAMSGCNAGPTDDPEPEVSLGVSTHAITYNGHDYLFVTTPKSWNAAWSHCQSAGYELVSVSDSNEESWLHSQQLNKAPYETKWWIGLYDGGIEGSWYWTDGTPVGYLNWFPGQPDNKYSDEDCAVDGWGQQWNDWACGNAANFICEKSSVSSSYTSSFTYHKINTANATTNTEQRSLYAYAGQVVTVGTCGIFGGSVSFGDTWLRIRNTTGSEIASNDDSCGGVGSNISFVAATTGNYTIHAGCYSNGECAGTVAYKVGP
jgi:hypothetical protein